MGKPSTERQRALAIRAAHMREEGATSREIAAAVGITPEQVKKRVELGQRLISTRGPSPTATPSEVS